VWKKPTFGSGGKRLGDTRYQQSGVVIREFIYQAADWQMKDASWCVSALKYMFYGGGNRHRPNISASFNLTCDIEEFKS